MGCGGRRGDVRQPAVSQRARAVKRTRETENLMTMGAWDGERKPSSVPAMMSSGMVPGDEADGLAAGEGEGLAAAEIAGEEDAGGEAKAGSAGDEDAGKLKRAMRGHEASRPRVPCRAAHRR